MSKKGLSKAEAGKLLSQFLRQIAEEKTERIEDPEQGDRIASKAEALARVMWKIALGYTEFDPKTQKEKIHKPDKSMIKLLYERIEGKVPESPRVKGDTEDVADKVTALGRKRINAISST